MAHPSGIDAYVNQEIFRKDHKLVLAAKVEAALILPIRLVSKGTDYAAGTTLAAYSSSAGALEGEFNAYANNGGSGLDTAKCILLDDVVDPGAGNTTLARGLYKGIVYKTALVGWDADAATDLGAKEIVSAISETLVSF